MPVIAPTTPFGNTVFCDDFRQEANGKLLYIGVYPADMQMFGTLPLMLSTLWILVKYSERPNESNEIVTIKVFLPGKELPNVEMPLDLTELRKMPIPADVEGVDKFLTILIPICLSPFLVEHEGMLRVRAYRGDDEIRLGALPVKVAPTPEGFPVAKPQI